MTATYIVLYAVTFLCAFVLGHSVARVRISHRVFSPWLRSIKPGDADFWLRSRDWGAAFDAYLAADVLWSPVKGDGREFGDSPAVLAAITASEVDRLLRAARARAS